MANPRRAPGLITRAGFLAVALGTSAGAEPVERIVLPPDDAGLRVSALQAGARGGASVVLVHGTPGSANVWEAMLDAPRDGFHLTAIDRPGFGETSPQGVEVRLTRQAEAIEPLLESAPAILVGHSLGGSVVLEAAARFGDRVRGVVVAAGALDPDLEDVWAVQYWGQSPLLRWLLPRTLYNSNEELIAYEAELRQLAPRLAQVSCPVVIVHGTEDRQVPYANVPFMEAALGRNAAAVETVRLDGADHFLPWKHTDTLWEAVERIRALSAAAGSGP